MPPPDNDKSKAELRRELAQARRSVRLFGRIIFLCLLAFYVWLFRAELISFLQKLPGPADAAATG